MQRLKPALGMAFSGHSPSVDLLGETFGPVRTEFLEPEQPTEEPSSCLADHQRSRLGETLEAFGKIGVWPTTASSRAHPSPIRSPTTTRPVATPTRTATD